MKHLQGPLSQTFFAEFHPVFSLSFARSLIVLTGRPFCLVRLLSLAPAGRLLLLIAFNFVGFKECRAGNNADRRFGTKWLLVNELPCVKGILFPVVGRRALVIGKFCSLSSVSFTPSRTRCHRAAPLGGNFPFLAGVSRLRSSTSLIATRSTMAAIPLRMLMIRKGKVSSPFR